MSVEHCDSLRPSIKAKLQNAGFLWLRDVHRYAQGGTAYDVLSVGEHASGSRDSNAASRLQQVCPQLTRDEAVEVVLCAMSLSESQGITGSCDVAPTIRSLRDLLELGEATELESVTSLCRSLDVLLGGGPRVGAVTELCGPPGVGKTQLSMQLAVNCLLPKELGGLDGGCLFIDTEGSFLSERFCEIAQAAVSHVEKIVSHRESVGIGCGNVVVAEKTNRANTEFPKGGLNGGESPGGVRGSPSGRGRKRARSGSKTPVRVPSSTVSVTPVPSPAASITVAASSFTVDRILGGTKYVRVVDVTSLMALLNTLPAYISRYPEIRMVIIDSIAFPFRSFAQLGAQSHDLENTEKYSGKGKGVNAFDGQIGTSDGSTSPKKLNWQRTRLIFRCGQLLQRYAREMKLCIVVSNQMTSRLADGCKDPGQFRMLVPALGDSWAYGLSTRLLLSYQHDALHQNMAEKHAEKTNGNMVFITQSAGGTANSNVVQHRVARLVKSPTEARGQCCFSISSMGVRDVFQVTF
uniref:DNA repair protein RAD51 homolog 3 n=1 Tax=Trypanosoma congolense (strain IL3000) TaxID=1068625 RepID=F9W6X5_TRYCI|nr:unnamed protein product [Trypanosoma congolense IL3000]